MRERVKFEQSFAEGGVRGGVEGVAKSQEPFVNRESFGWGRVGGVPGAPLMVLVLTDKRQPGRHWF